MFRTFLDEHDYIPDPEDSKGERVLLVMLGVTSVFSALFLLLPLVALRHVWREVPYKINAGVYFAALGLGFMFFEISLIQKLTLFLGYPSYSLTVTLFALLISSGIGSLLSERYAQRRGAALGVLLVAVSVMAWFYQYVVPVIVDQFIGLPLPVRMMMAVTFLFPLGLCLGAFMPIALKTVAALSRHEREYVAWAWAVNGFFSVTASTLATILSMSFGFRFVLVLAVLNYAVGIAAVSRIPLRRSA